jgi:hypothetical protein
MKTCAVIGEAAGTAAAVSAREGMTPRDLSHSDSCLRVVQQQLLRQGAYLPLQQNDDEHDLVRRKGAVASASSSATLQLGNTFGWEAPGISTAESAGLAAALEEYPAGKELPLDRALAQAVVVSGTEITALSLPLENGGAEPVTVTARLRQARHLRDFGPLGDSRDDLGAWTIEVGPGRHDITIPLTAVAVEPGMPIVIIIDPAPGVSWARVWQEPPGTQAARWDADLGYWRWEHGTLGFTLAPVSAPFGPEQVTSGVTRPGNDDQSLDQRSHGALPQWWEVTWPETQLVSSVEVTFDSQLSGWIWEGAFPLIPRAYDVQLREPGSGAWHTVASSEANVQRRVVHTFPAVRSEGVRLVIRETGGGTTARLVEVRAYGPAA